MSCSTEGWGQTRPGVKHLRFVTAFLVASSCIASVAKAQEHPATAVQDEAASTPPTMFSPSAGTFGMQLSLSGDPFPSLLGAGVHYYLLEFLRAEANVGWVGVGMGVRLSVPGWDLTPVIGLAGAETYLGGEWELGAYGTLGLQLFGRRGWSLEGGLSCAPRVFDGDFAECLPYLRFGAVLHP